MKITGLHLYVIKRFAYMIVSIFLISVIVFAATQVLPGNAASLILGRKATPEKVAALEQQLGLSRPLHIQYTDWLFGMLSLDAGRSLALRRPVLEIVIPKFRRSVMLAITTLIVTAFVGIPLGIIGGVKRNSISDRTISSVSYIGVSFPEFVTGTLLIILLGGPIFGVLPGSGYAPLSEGVIPWIQHLILPILTLTLVLLAHIMRQTRSEMIEVLQSEYIRAARLKGLNERTVLVKHALRNALLPTITLLALNLGWLMSGLVVVEEVYAFPGLGRAVIFAIQNRDIPLLQFLVLVIAVTYTVANFGADILYTYLDPRIDYGDAK